MKLSDYVMDVLAGHDVKHVFMLAGGAAMHLNNSLGMHPSLQAVPCLHEHICAVAAEGYARVNGTLGACLVTVGPGATNALTGLAGAWMDSTPVIFISGQVKVADLKGTTRVRQKGVQEIDILSMVSHMTKFCAQVQRPEDIGPLLFKAIYFAQEGRPGPVWIDIPLDVQAMDVDTVAMGSYYPPPSTSMTDRLYELERIPDLHDWLRQAQRPLLLVGNGARAAMPEVIELATTFHIPILTTWLGQDLLEDDHHLLVGRPGPLAPRGANFALQTCDMLLSVGARLDLALLGYDPFKCAVKAWRSAIDIDGAELTKYGDWLHHPIRGDAQRILKLVLAKKTTTIATDVLGDREAWRRRCMDWRNKYPAITEERRSTLNTYALCDKLSDLCTPEDVIVFTSSGAAIGAFFQSFRCKKGQRIFHNRGTGSMGFALPSAIGACLASGRRRTICIEADGSLAMNPAALATIKSLELPIKIFVLNNDGYASIRNSQQRHFQHEVGADWRSGAEFPYISSLASAYNLTSFKIANKPEWRESVDTAMNYIYAAVCDVQIPKDEEYSPCMQSRIGEKGEMISSTLEDLYPFLPRDELAANLETLP